jgi:hypothetical protein
MKLTELYAVQDVFASGLGRVDVLGGGFVRFVWYVERKLDDGTTENVIVASVIASIDSIQPGRNLIEAAINQRPAAPKLVLAGVH